MNTITVILTFHHLMNIIPNVHVYIVTYGTVVSNKEELNVFLLLDNRYTLEGKRTKQIKALFS